jgi:transcription initiation factor TFIIB
MATEATTLSPGQIPDEVVPVYDEPRENLNVRLICRYCQIDPPDLIEDSSAGTITCAECGHVMMENVIDVRSEWRNFSNDESTTDDPSRVGDARDMLLNGSQLSTEITFEAASRDLHRTQNRSNEDKSNKILMEGYNQIASLCDSSSYPAKIQTTAKLFYKLAVESKKFRGKPSISVIASAIFLACRQNNLGRAYKELMQKTKVTKKDLGRLSKAMVKVIKASPIAKQMNFNTVVTTSPKDLCGRFADQLGIPKNLGIMAGELSEVCINEGPLSGRSPLSVAAVALYIVTNLMGVPKTAKECATACQVSDGTIRQSWKLVYPDCRKLIPKEWLERGGNLANLPPV